MLIRVGLTTLDGRKGNYSDLLIFKYIDYMTENYFLWEKEILFFLWDTEKPTSCLIYSCLIIVIIEIVASESRCDLPNLSL